MKYSVLSFVLVSLVSLVHADTFNNSDSHSIINTKEAWNQNIIRYLQIRSNNQRYTPNFKNRDKEVCDLHGSHVTGIAIGSYGTYFGVAHNANAYSIGAIQSPGASAPAPMGISSYFWYKDDVKILNNSWGSNVYPFIDTEIKNAKVSGS